MNEITTFSKMTSMEIAEVTGKRHDNIMRDIHDEAEKLQNSGIDTELKFELSERQDSTGRKIPYYILTKEGVLQLAARYDAVVRAKLIELAMKQEEKPLHIDSKFLFSIAAQLEEKEKTIALMQPKADYFDNLVERNLLTNFRDTAKEFKLKQSEFIDWLISNGYIYRDSKKKLKPYAQYTPSLFEMKEFANALHADNQTLITPKGRETFRLLLTQLIA